MLIKEDRDCINFIDKNDCFVGFDWRGQCGENFGYYVALEITEDESACDESLDGFFFDTDAAPIDISNDSFGVDGCVAFKCINDAGDVRYLHLYNHHNGYYSHGWDSSWSEGGSL